MPLTFSRTILHGANSLITLLPLLRRRPPLPPGLVIGTLNRRDGWGFGLVQAIRAVERGGFDVMLLKETKIQTEAYSHNYLGYNVTCFSARPSSARGSQGLVGLVMREWLVGWGIESMRFHGPSVVSCEIVTRPTQDPLVDAYLPPLTMEHLPYFNEELQRFKVRDTIVLGDLNVELDNVRTLRIQSMAELLT